MIVWQLGESIRELKKRVTLEAFTMCEKNVERTALLLKESERGLRYKLQRYGAETKVLEIEKQKERKSEEAKVTESSGKTFPDVPELKFEKPTKIEQAVIEKHYGRHHK
jgi:hypothetical protein